MKTIKYISFSVLVIIILFFLTGLFAPSVTYESRISVDRPVDKSFMMFLNTEKMKEWLTGFKKIELIQGFPNMPGSKFRMTFEMNGREIVAIEEVVEFKWNELFAFRLDHKIMTVDSRISFIPDGLKTNIVSTNRVTGNNLFWKSINVFLKGSMARQSQGDYDRLKEVIEAS